MVQHMALIRPDLDCGLMGFEVITVVLAELGKICLEKVVLRFACIKRVMVEL